MGAGRRDGRLVPPSTAPARRPRLRAIDSAATGPGSWWSGPLEEAENDLL